MEETQLVESYNIIRDIEDIREVFYNKNDALPYTKGDFIDLLDGLRHYRKTDGQSFYYSFEDYIVHRFRHVLLKKDIDKVLQSYLRTSEYRGDYRGYIHAILRRIEKGIKVEIALLADFNQKDALIEICDEFRPNLIRHGVNSKNLEIQDNTSQLIANEPEARQAIAAQNGNLPKEICPIYVNDGHTENSFNEWVGKLYLGLCSRRLIDDYHLNDFKNIFTLTKEKRKVGIVINWLGTGLSLGFLIQMLGQKKYINEPFWPKVASCFTILGEHKKATNIKSNANKAKAEDRYVIVELIKKIAP